MEPGFVSVGLQSLTRPQPTDGQHAAKFPSTRFAKRVVAAASPFNPPWTRLSKSGRKTTPSSVTSPATTLPEDPVRSLIGGTPLVQLRKISAQEQCQATIWLKLESMEPNKSVKDRIGYYMIKKGEEAGDIVPGKTTLIEPTSGNTGIGLAFTATRKGYPLTLTMPETMSIERRMVMLGYGAKVVLTPGKLGMGGAIAKANELLQTTPNAVMLQQFDNPNNVLAHYETTGPEIFEASHGRVDILVSGVGTGGTISGTGKFLKEKLGRNGVTCVAVEPAESAVLSGQKPGPHKIQGIGAGFKPSILDESVIDEVIAVASADAITMARRMTKEEGIFVGISSGAALTAAIKLAKRPENWGKNIVCIIPSFGERYLSSALFTEEAEQAKTMVTEDVDVPSGPASAKATAMPVKEPVAMSNTEDWSKMTVKKLKEELKARGVPFASRLLKKDLVELLQKSV